MLLAAVFRLLASVFLLLSLVLRLLASVFLLLTLVFLLLAAHDGECLLLNLHLHDGVVGDDEGEGAHHHPATKITKFYIFLEFLNFLFYFNSHLELQHNKVASNDTIRTR